MRLLTTKRALAITMLMASLLVLLLPSVAWAHSLDSSTISVHVADDAVDATITVALETLDEAMGNDYVASDPIDDEAISAYLAEHLTVTDDEGNAWGESYSSVTRETVEGIDSISVTVTFDVGDSDTADFVIAYDGVIEAVDGHEAVVVLTDANGAISSPGIIASSGETVEISDASSSIDAGDMVAYGFDHVLEGADHLLFLLTLLLPAPLVVVGNRWRGGRTAPATVRKVVHVVTAFTLGHSLTLVASTLGWISLPSRAVEVAIAVSVAVSAVHAMRPLAKHGEVVIAAGFGLVHGLAFAGILTDLGLSGSTSLLALLAFNIGVELSQLITTLFLFPSLYLLSRTGFYPIARVGGASIALAAAVGWAVDRLGLLSNPFSGLEDAVIAHPWHVVVGAAVLSGGLWVMDRRSSLGVSRIPAREGAV